jgi:hypothetical protein
MSAFAGCGHKAPNGCDRVVPGADICSAANSSLFNYLIGEREQRWRVYDESFRRLQVDDENAIEAISISGRRSNFFTAGN